MPSSVLCLVSWLTQSMTSRGRDEAFSTKIAEFSPLELRKASEHAIASIRARLDSPMNRASSGPTPGVTALTASADTGASKRTWPSRLPFNSRAMSRKGFSSSMRLASRASSNWYQA